MIFVNQFWLREAVAWFSFDWQNRMFEFLSWAKNFLLTFLYYSVLLKCIGALALKLCYFQPLKYKSYGGNDKWQMPSHVINWARFRYFRFLSLFQITTEHKHLVMKKTLLHKHIWYNLHANINLFQIKT